MECYLVVKKICYAKYVDEYFGRWIENVQTKMNTTAFHEMMGKTCSRKLLLNNKTVGVFAYSEEKDKIDGIFTQMVGTAQNKGIGSFYLKYITTPSERINKPIFLKVFKSNPAQNLYRRFSFEIYCKTSTHCLIKYTPVKINNG